MRHRFLYKSRSKACLISTIENLHVGDFDLFLSGTRNILRIFPSKGNDDMLAAGPTLLFSQQYKQLQLAVLYNLRKAVHEDAAPGVRGRP